MIKTTQIKVLDLQKVVMENHPYDTPEFISISIEDSNSSPNYLQWLQESTK
jgi:uncharacterized protein involved in tolerance to divalent cations